MLKILIISKNLKAETIVKELESLENEVTLLDNLDSANELILKGIHDILLIDYDESQKLSKEEIEYIRYFSQSPYELPIYILLEGSRNDIPHTDRECYSGIFPYNHSVDMVNEFISHFHPLNTG
ncbi:MAG TPA: hypothetical protein PLX23_12575 [Candidatus Hydrogenedens sp.]|nr:hypothetical protein [Candidatus Hydrogenedens sp.]